MIILDLDRTLLRNDKSISEYSINILEKCKMSGYIISFATARQKRGILNYKEIVRPIGLVLNNGANIYVKDRLLKQFGIPSKKTKEIVGLLERRFPNATLSVEIDDVMYTNFIPPDKTPYVKINFNELPEKIADRIVIGTIPLEEIMTIEHLITEDLYFELNYGRYGFIMDKKVSKWLGVVELLKYLGIKIENTIAFGDDFGDIEIIKNCGRGICVKNGLEEVKAVADELCDSNENDGVAKWLEKNLL